MSKLIIEVCKVLAVEKHPNADKLDIITVKGWNCIVGKGNYKPNDLVVYCPPDSVIPSDIIEKYKLEFLKKSGRVGRIKLRGAISEGLILDCNEMHVTEGQDVASDLGITKYEVAEGAPSVRGGQQISKKRSNPFFTQYTDIDNIKNFPNVFKEGEEVVITEKIHGSNFRVGNLAIGITNPWQWFKVRILGHTHEFCYGSRTVQKKFYQPKAGFYKEDVWYAMVKKYNLEKIVPKDCLLYGEIYGPKIQDLTYGKQEVEVVFFDVKYKDRYLSVDEKVRLFDLFKLPMVPPLYKGAYSKEVVALCTVGNSFIDPTQIREGCVITSFEECVDICLGRKILKSINLDYLLRKAPTEFH